MVGFVLVGEAFCRDRRLVATSDHSFIEFETNRRWQEKERTEIGRGPGLYRATVIARADNEKRCSKYGDYTLADPKKRCVAFQKIARPTAKHRARLYTRTGWNGIGQITEHGRLYESADGKTRYAIYRSFTAASRLLFGYMRNPDADYLGFGAASCAVARNRKEVGIKKILIPVGKPGDKKSE